MIGCTWVNDQFFELDERHAIGLPIWTRVAVEKMPAEIIELQNLENS